MRKTIGFLLIPVFVLLFINGLGVNVQIPEPAAVTVPGHIKTVVIINRTEIKDTKNYEEI